MKLAPLALATILAMGAGVWTLPTVAEGAALMTETKMEFVPIVGVWQYLPNQVLAKVGFANATLVGVPPFTDEDEKIAEPFSKSLKVEKGPFLSR